MILATMMILSGCRLRARRDWSVCAMKSARRRFSEGADGVGLMFTARCHRFQSVLGR